MVLPQLVQEIQEKITKGTVECMICYDMLRNLPFELHKEVGSGAYFCRFVG